jgi:hypothetical protein
MGSSVEDALVDALSLAVLLQASCQSSLGIHILNWSNFLAARLGEKHEHTIENMYSEAALATRLEKNSEASRIPLHLLLIEVDEGNCSVHALWRNRVLMGSSVEA